MTYNLPGPFCIYLFVSFIGVLRHTQEYFTYTSSASILMRRNPAFWEEPRRTPYLEELVRYAN